MLPFILKILYCFNYAMNRNAGNNNKYCPVAYISNIHQVNVELLFSVRPLVFKSFLMLKYVLMVPSLPLQIDSYTATTVITPTYAACVCSTVFPKPCAATINSKVCVDFHSFTS